MSAQSTEEPPLTPAEEEFRRLWLKIQQPAAAWQYWQKCLHADERAFLESRFGDFYKACAKLGTSGLYGETHCCSPEEAVCGAGLQLGFLTRERHDWLLVEAGVAHPDEEAFVEWATRFDGLALVAERQLTYWRGCPFDCDWYSCRKIWMYFWTLCFNGSRSQDVDFMTFGSAEPSTIRNWKSRLLNHANFPPDLGEYIPNASAGVHRITLPSSRLRVLRVDLQGRVVLETSRRA